MDDCFCDPRTSSLGIVTFSGPEKFLLSSSKASLAKVRRLRLVEPNDGRQLVVSGVCRFCFVLWFFCLQELWLSGAQKTSTKGLCCVLHEEARFLDNVLT